MSEWLTTGKMIDTLKVGEVAESNGQTLGLIKLDKVRVIRTEDGAIAFEDDKNKALSLNQLVYPLNWHILPEYVTFDKAMKALKDGKTVTCYSDGLVPHLVSYNLKEDGQLKGIHYERVLDGKWQIIE